MDCPKCKSKTKVIVTRKILHGVYRYRKCLKCGYRFSTKEFACEHKPVQR